MKTMAIFILDIDSVANSTALRCRELFESREDAMASLNECVERFLDRNPGEWHRDESEGYISLMSNPGFFTGSVSEFEIIPKGGKVIAERGTKVRCNERDGIYATLGSTVTTVSKKIILSNVIDVNGRRRVPPEEMDLNMTWTGVYGEEASKYDNIHKEIFDAELRHKIINSVNLKKIHI